jgi:hypothetical protein|tara:strand:- start:123 stop:1796 length:1674 start_codon:yes stop_codon:yes gene_type:complete
MARNIKNRYTRKQIEKIIMERTGGDDPGYLPDEDVNRINALAKSKGGVYFAWDYLNKSKNNPTKNQNLLRTDITGKQVQERVLRGTGRKITLEQANKKAKRENSTNRLADDAATIIASGIPAQLVIATVAKVGRPVLQKILQNSTVRNAISRAAAQGEKIPAKVTQAVKAIANKTDDAIYRATGKLPSKKTTGQSTFNDDMERIATQMDRVARASKIPAGPASKIPAQLSDDIQMAAGRIMGQRPVGENIPLSSRNVGGVTPAMGERAAGLANLGSRRMNPPRSADPSMATLASQRGYARDASGRIIPHMRASGPRYQETSPLFGPTARSIAAQPRYSPGRGPGPTGPNLTRTALVAAMGTKIFDDLNTEQKAVLTEAIKEPSSFEDDPIMQSGTFPERQDEIFPSDSLSDTDDQIAEGWLGRNLFGMRRSAREIERDVAITEALESDDPERLERVAELEAKYGPAPVEESLTYRTRDKTPEEIEAMLAPDTSGPVEAIQELVGGFGGFGDLEPSEDTSSNPRSRPSFKKGGRVKAKKKKSSTSKSYTNKTRKPTRA